MPETKSSADPGVTSAGASKKTFRPDIQGLRAFAVVAVVIDHLFGWPGGGFVGVDVFFVISGFLITSLLLKEHDRTGHISFLGFYRRRIKRILPAATLVLAVTAAASYFLFNSVRFMQTATDAIWAFFFSANWHFNAQGTNYFQATGPTSPLQHFWSLSVEEQFYFVWPWLMLLILLIGARSANWTLHRGRIAAGSAMAIIIIGSFAWAMFQTAANPASAYFSTFTRAWELGIGALVAVAAGAFARIPARLRPLLGWVGVLGIVAAIFITPASAGFPAPWAALAVGSTAIAIIGGTGGRQRFVGILTNPVSGWLGDISYSLYLWHFPVIILLGTLLVPATPVFYAVALVGMFALSTASYYLVEDPIRRSHFLERLTPAQRRELQLERFIRRSRRNTGRSSVVGLVVLAMVTVVTVSVALLPRSASYSIDFTDASSPLSPTASPTPTPTLKTAIARDIYSALGKTSWPTLSPSIDSVLSGRQAPADISACSGVKVLPASQCTFGPASATKTAVIVGDSTSVAYTIALKDLATSSGSDLRIVAEGMFGCPFVDIPIQNSDASLVSACPGRISRAISEINSIHPDLVIVTNTYQPRIKTTGGDVSNSEWTAGVTRLTDKFRSSAGKIVFLSPPPASKNIQTCYTALSHPSDCVSTVTSAWTGMAKTETALAKSVGGLFIDSRQWFCVDGRCPAFIGKVPVKLDLVHITTPFAARLAPLLRTEFAADKLL